MRKQHLTKRILILFLALLLFPVPEVIAEKSEVITVNAVRMFTEEQAYIQLLTDGGDCYISLPETAKLLGAVVQETDSDCTFSGAFTKRTVIPFEVDFVLYGDTYYYRLEDLMNRLDVHVHAANGILFYHDPWHNLDSYLQILKDVLADDTFEANMLNSSVGSSLLGAALEYYANIYDAIRNQRIDVFWGGAYQKDARDLLLKLLSPVDNEGFNINVFSGIGKANKTLRKAAKHLLGAEEIYEDWKELFLDIPKGSDPLLFGINGTRELRELLETTQEINKLDLSRFILCSRIERSEWMSYQQAAKDLKLDQSADIHMFSFADLISLGSYCIDVINKDTANLSTLSAVMDAVSEGSYLGSDGLWGSMERQYIYREAEKISNLWKMHQAKGDDEQLRAVPQVWSFLFRESSEMALDNALEDIFTSSLSPKASLELTLGVTIATGLIDSFAHALGRDGYDTVEQMDAVRQMYLLSQIQMLFKECIQQGLENPSLKRFRLYQGSGELYIKCAWMASDGFSNSYLKNAGISVGRLHNLMEQKMAELLSFPDTMFEVAETDTIFAEDLADSTINASAAEHLSNNYVRTCYVDSGKFNAKHDELDNAETLHYTYRVPEIIPDLPGAREINQTIRDRFDRYVSGTDTSHVLHNGGTLLPFRTVLSANKAGRYPILLSMQYESNVWADRILSLQLTIRTHEIGNYRFTNETTVYNLDLKTGRVIDGQQFLTELGISTFDFWQRARAIMINRCTEAWTALAWEYYPGYEKDLEQARVHTLSMNSLDDLLNRGFFLTKEGRLQIVVYIDNGAFMIEETIIEITPDAPPEEILDAVYPGSSVPAQKEIMQTPVPTAEPTEEPLTASEGIHVGSDYCYLTVPSSWKGHFYAEETAPGRIAIYDSDNRDAGYGGHLFDLVLSKRFQSSQQLLDHALNHRSETYAASLVYLGKWSKGIVYLVKETGIAYSEQDAALREGYLSRFGFASQAKKHFTVQEERAKKILSDIKE